MSPRRIRVGAMLAALLLAAVAGTRAAELEESVLKTDEELFAEATKVMLGKVVHYGEEETAPGSLPHARYRYQAIWVKEVKRYKGPPPPEQFGYEVVLLPIRTKRFGPPHMLTGLVGPGTLPEGEEVVFFLRPDEAGAWTLVGGRHGLQPRPGGTQKANLERWGKAPTGKPSGKQKR